MNSRSRLLSAAMASLLLSFAACGDDGRDAADAGADAAVGACPTCDSICADSGCAEGAACHEVSGEIQCATSECWPGYVLSDVCRLDPAAHCDSGAAGGIDVACNDLGRECKSFEGGATCGACLEGYVEVDLRCEPSEACEAANCLGQNRLCGAEGSCGGCAAGYVDQGGECNVRSCDACAGQHRRCDESGPLPVCGSCLEGYGEEGGVCEPFIACEDLDCAAQGRACVEASRSYCDSACIDGLVWDEEAQACRPKLGCEVVAPTCDDGDVCLEGAAGQDASCVADCPSGTAWSTELAGGEGCFACSDPTFTSERCHEDGTRKEGLTGRVVNVDGLDDGTCGCETAEGYFPNANKTEATLCDADGDGWVTLNAYADVEKGSPGVREQARCDVRRITTVRLEGDDPAVAAPTTVMEAMPLYERPDNDAGTSFGKRPAYPTQAGNVYLDNRALNSLTKACTFIAGDYNLNGKNDFQEDQTYRPGAGEGFSDPDIATLFGQYARFSYFIEINEGWFEAPSTYVIAERFRDPRHSPDLERIAFVPPGDTLSPSGTEDEPTGARYWRACSRHDDVVGGDFSAADFDVDTGMFHHSQFRCVQPFTEETYNSFGIDAAVDSARAYWVTSEVNGLSLGWKAGGVGVEFADANLCSPTGTPYRRAAAEASAINPQSRGFSCYAPPSSGVLLTNQLVWAVVRYANARDVEDAVDPTGYVRGCINECAELGVTECPTYDANNPSSGFVCDGAATDSFGQIQCGCSEGYSGPDTSCAMACAPSSTFKSEQLTPLNRGDDAFWDAEGVPGYWACLDRTVTSTVDADGQAAPILTSPSGYRLRAHIPAGLGVSAQVLRSPVNDGHDYSLRSRVRAEVRSFGG